MDSYPLLHSSMTELGLASSVSGDVDDLVFRDVWRAIGRQVWNEFGIHVRDDMRSSIHARNTHK